VLLKIQKVHAVILSYLAISTNTLLITLIIK